MSRAGFASAALALCIGWPLSSRAADHTNLDEGLPVTVTDAYATHYLNTEVQLLAGYLRTKDDANVLSFTPRFEVGFPRNAQISVGMPLLAVTGEQLYPGRAHGEAFYNLNVETLVIPALALAAGVDMPTGRDDEGKKAHGADPIFSAFLTKSIPGTLYWHRLHLNASYQLNGDRREDERSGRYRLVAGYSFRISASMVGIADVGREQGMEEDKTENYAELGLRYQANPLLVLAVGGGVGFAEDSAPARAAVSLQYRAF